jgi:hypothetical protein
VSDTRASGLLLLAAGVFVVMRTVRGERKLPDLILGGS